MYFTDFNCRCSFKPVQCYEQTNYVEQESDKWLELLRCSVVHQKLALTETTDATRLRTPIYYVNSSLVFTVLEFHANQMHWVLSHWQISCCSHWHSLFSSYTTFSWCPTRFHLRPTTFFQLYLPNCSHSRSIWHPTTTISWWHTALCGIINKLISQSSHCPSVLFRKSSDMVMQYSDGPEFWEAKLYPIWHITVQTVFKRSWFSKCRWHGHPTGQAS